MKERERERENLIKLYQYIFGYAIVKLSNVAHYSKERISVSDVDKDTYVGVDNLLPGKQGKEESAHLPTSGNCIKFIPGDILIGNIRPYLKKIWISNSIGGTNGDVLVIRPVKKFVAPKFLYYVLSSDNFFAYDTQYAKGAKMPRGNKDAVMEYIFALPTIKEQERIISILDRFDALCNDLSSGLPAEIEARRKQYEFYRDKLLTFNAKEV